jgi:hypothetical protein
MNRDPMGKRETAAGRDPMGKRALFSSSAEPKESESHNDEGDRAKVKAPAQGKGGATWSSWLRNPLTSKAEVSCSRCKATTTVDLVDLAILHLPVFLWHPGRGFTHLMTCPGCRRRAWVSVALRFPEDS